MLNKREDSAIEPKSTEYLVNLAHKNCSLHFQIEYASNLEIQFNLLKYKENYQPLLNNGKVVFLYL